MGGNQVYARTESYFLGQMPADRVNELRATVLTAVSTVLGALSR